MNIIDSIKLKIMIWKLSFILQSRNVLLRSASKISTKNLIIFNIIKTYSYIKTLIKIIFTKGIWVFLINQIKILIKIIKFKIIMLLLIPFVFAENLFNNRK